MKFLKGKWKAKYTLWDSREQGLNKLHECEDFPLSIYHVKYLFLEASPVKCIVFVWVRELNSACFFFF